MSKITNTNQRLSSVHEHHRQNQAGEYAQVMLYWSLFFFFSGGTGQGPLVETSDYLFDPPGHVPTNGFTNSSGIHGHTGCIRTMVTSQVGRRRGDVVNDV